MHNLVARHSRREIGPVKRQIEHMTVVAPVRTEDQQNALVLLRSLFFRFFDLSARIGVRGINILVLVHRLLQVSRIRTLHHDEPPPTALLLPHLAFIHKKSFGFWGDAGLNLSLKPDDLNTRLR